MAAGRRVSYQQLLDEENDPRVQKDIEQRKRVGLYQIKYQLGTGNFSKVKLAVHILTKEMVAMKVIDKSQLDTTHKRTILSQEITCMEKLRHTNIIRLFEVIDTFSHTHLIMEYAPEGDLEQRLKREGHFNEINGKLIFRQIVSGVDYMHSKGVIHRDIKAENIFFLRGYHIKIGDFGFSTTTITNLHDYCGSPPYAAPELLKEETYNGLYVDIWAIGILLYYMLTGNLPFNGPDLETIKHKVLQGQLPFNNFLSDTCTRLIQCILQLLPADRLSIKSILNSDWLRDSIEGDGQEGVSSENSCESLDLEILSEMTEGYGIPRQNTTTLNSPNNDIAGTYRILHNRKISSLQPTPTGRGLDTNSIDIKGLGHSRQRKSKICIIL